MKYSIMYYIWVHCPISIIYEKFHSCDFTKNIWMKFFIQTSVSVWIHNCFLKKQYHLKDNKNCERGLVSKIHFQHLKNIKWNEKKSTPKIIQNILKNEYIFLLEMYHHSVFSPWVGWTKAVGKGFWRGILIFTTFHHIHVLTIFVFLKLILSPLVWRCRALIHN